MTHWTLRNHAGQRIQLAYYESLVFSHQRVIVEVARIETECDESEGSMQQPPASPIDMLSPELDSTGSEWPLVPVLTIREIQEVDNRQLSSWLASSPTSETTLRAPSNILTRLFRSPYSYSTRKVSEGTSTVAADTAQTLASYLGLPLSQSGAYISLMHQRMQSIRGDKTISGIELGQCLIATARVLKASTSPKELVAGDVLDELYRRNLLQQPTSPQFNVTIRHVSFLANLLTVFDIWSTQFPCDLETKQSSLASLCNSISQVKKLPLRSLIDENYTPRLANRSSSSSSLTTTRMFRRGRRFNNGDDDFNANDLNIARLMSIGGIRIEWTSDMSEHLRLYGGGLEDDVSDETKEISDVSYRLSLYWFDARELTYIARYAFNPSANFPRLQILPSP